MISNPYPPKGYLRMTKINCPNCATRERNIFHSTFLLLVWLGLLFLPAVTHAAPVSSLAHFETGYPLPVLSGGPAGSWDEGLVEKVQVIQEGGQFKMWYSGYRAGDPTTSKIGYATSTDGINWIRYAGNPIIDRPSQDQDIAVVKVSATSYYMYIEVNDIQIDLLTSADGIHWSPNPSNPVKTVATSPVVWREGSNWFMLYEYMLGPVFDIRLATSSNGIDWVDSPANPVLSEEQSTVPDSIVKDGDTYHLTYHRDHGGWPEFHATSTDLTTWSDRAMLYTFSSQFTFRTASGEVWAYVWDINGDQKYHLRYGLEPPAFDSLVRHFIFDETSGTTAHDSSVNHADGTLYNGPIWTTGKIGGGLQFDGVDDYVDTGFNTDLPRWTISSWVKSPNAPAANPASGPIVREKNFQISWDHPDPRFRGGAAVFAGSGWIVASFGELQSDTWYLLTASYDGETLRAYRDGTLVTASAAVFPADPSPEDADMTIGKSAVAEQYFAGTIDEVRVHSRALSDFEIATLYQYGKLPPSAPIGVAAVPSGETNILSWVAANDFETGVIAYRIYRGTTSANKTLLGEVGTAEPLIYTDSATLPQTTYYYQISAVNGTSLEGPRSATVFATTGNTPPEMPEGLTPNLSNGQVSLDWSDDPEADLAGYFIYRATDPAGPFVRLNSVPVPQSTFTTNGLVEGVTYYFRVTAVDTAGNESAPSATVVVVVPLPALSINSITVTEGNGGTVSANFTVTLSPASSQTVSVNYSILNGTAAAGSDFTSASGTLTFTPGVTTRPVTVSVIGDCLLESNETFTVRLANPNHAVINIADGVGTILNDDNRALSIGGVTITEGNSGTTSAVFNVSLSSASCANVSVNYATANGSALAGADYQSTSGTLVFSSGQVTKQITVPIVGDLVNEPTETFLVNLSSPVNATLAIAQGVGTIQDNDPVPVVSFRDDFNDNVRDTSKWLIGCGLNVPLGWDSAVTTVEQNGRLEITPRSNASWLHYNGYMSAATWDMTNGRAQVEVLQITKTSAATMSFAIGRDLLNWYAFTLSNDKLYLQEFKNGSTSSASFTGLDFDITQHGFWRFRHDPANSRLLFEASGDGATWTTLRTVQTSFSLTNLRVVLTAGTLFSVGSPGKAIFDNFILRSNNPPDTNQLPTANAGGPYGSKTGQAVSFSSSGSSDPDGSITSYQWNFGDGTNGVGASTAHTYSVAGNYVVTLTVTDNGGASKRTSTTAVISVAAPAAPTSLTASSNITGSVALAWQDKSNNELSFSIERSTSSSSGFAVVGSVNFNLTSFTNQGLPSNTTYYYRVRAVNSSGNSGYSNVVSIKTK